ncbi:MAG: hypothetical protein D6807_03065 [Alphaproteobacteria bacterium]|nr:MAG: hypothetical protein D6807_03065 [Alphaproteobacteria bacterium]
MPRHEPPSTLPAHVHLRMALDVLYSRALELGLASTAHLIGTAALSVDIEARERMNRLLGEDGNWERIDDAQPRP